MAAVASSASTWRRRPWGPAVGDGGPGDQGHRQIPRRRLAHPWSHSGDAGAGDTTSHGFGGGRLVGNDGIAADAEGRPRGGGGGAGEGEGGAEPCAADLQVVIAVCAGRNGRLGLAYIDLDEPERIIRATDVLDPEFLQLGLLKQALLSGGRAGLCALPARGPPELPERAAQPLRPAGGGGRVGAEAAEAFPVAVLKATDFEYEPCRQRLLLLRTSASGHDPADLPEGQRELQGNAVLDLSNEQLVRAAGGLVRFMERNRAHLGDLDEARRPLHLHGLRLFSLDTMLFVDAQTMAALQIFQEDRHPSMIRGSGRSKEGLSLFGLLEPFAASPMGRLTLRRWLQQPSRDLRLLRERHAAIEEFVRPRRAELLRELHRELREVRDTGALLRRIFGCYHFDNAHDWRSLVATLDHMTSALALAKAEVPAAVLKPLGDLDDLSADVAAAENLLHHFVDLEALAPGLGGSEVRVKSGVDDQLDAVREQYDTIDGHLTEVAQLERQRLLEEGVEQDLSDSVAFHYFPQLGFHASVPNPLAEAGAHEDAGAMEQLKRGVQPPSAQWRYQFAGGGRLFYKCPLAVRLDGEIGDLVVVARELELELLIGVVERLRRLEARLCQAGRLLADLDALIALAAAAKQFDWRRPRFTSDPGRIRIVKGRHPLVEATLTSHHGFVPNSTDLGAGGLRAEPASGSHTGAPRLAVPRVQVVTGANLAGKSVYLKQVGIITLLAQAGSFVPAEEAELGLCDFVFSRIQNCEGAAVRCSTFGIDLAQVAHALRHATSASLVLLDEFGKGTHAADGVALFGATVEYLCRWTGGPKTIVTTHFTEVFRFNLVSEAAPGLQLCSMRVLPPEDRDEGIAYLYQLVPGVAKQSFGIECAKKAGLDEDVLNRAAAILVALESGSPVPPPATGPCADAATRAAAQEGRRRGAAQLLVDHLCSMDPGDSSAARALLDFARSQKRLLEP